ncbi:TPA: hypothetical protein DEP30_03010 [Candidatus Nomurabacteria bacterium]|nr:MAG: hypothetical protein UR97_C0004G0109 [Candidatus Nomurabacteria bacterium GW2011_GWE2_36_115]KKP94240.1 MAG: hypothetical protein US00_C0003G0164 [Candidatus Nomurabacteria bacterium GW2011_GWF2_36_126]KKP96632.1 MAG: hypothetical protein US04_C0001G0134 [Candidatus Nomurabacteria bacterium GW2011_GWD2_36_14]KKP99764.1 MAG: hypothetical protein US08_C0001G0447 [Candidatus Nomurabacteria bacterium GW2011_GWF2_36_19]KKQ05290.1 MAG: hypothetical protein US17_C0005G0057 [Candidatus Nomuraba
MLKKILYVIVVIAVIVVLAIMWTDSKKEGLPQDDQATVNGDRQGAPAVNTNESIQSEMDTINLDSGIDADINGVNTDIKTL